MLYGNIKFVSMRHGSRNKLPLLESAIRLLKCPVEYVHYVSTSLHFIHQVHSVSQALNKQKTGERFNILAAFLQVFCSFGKKKKCLNYGSFC